MCVFQPIQSIQSMWLFKIQLVKQLKMVPFHSIQHVRNLFQNEWWSRFIIVSWSKLFQNIFFLLKMTITRARFLCIYYISSDPGWEIVFELSLKIPKRYGWQSTKTINEHIEWNSRHMYVFAQLSISLLLFTLSIPNSSAHYILRTSFSSWLCHSVLSFHAYSLSIKFLNFNQI